MYFPEEQTDAHGEVRKTPSPQHDEPDAWWLPRRHSRMSLWHSWLSFSLFSSSKSIMTFMTITVTVYRVMYMVDTNARTNNYGLTNSLNYIIVWKSCLVCNTISKTLHCTVEKNSDQACYEMLVSCTTWCKLDNRCFVYGEAVPMRNRKPAEKTPEQTEWIDFLIHVWKYIWKHATQTSLV